jgi:hypothetical protein
VTIRGGRSVCENRFFGWSTPASLVWYAHCTKCGNFDLQRIARDKVEHGHFLWLQRILGFRAYRCAPCRYRFFCARPRLHITPRDSRATSDRARGREAGAPPA